MSAADKLAQIQARADVAPEGDWFVNDDNSVWIDHSGTGDSMSGLTGSFPVWADGAATFIAHARQDVPALANALQAVLALHSESWGACTGCGGWDSNTAVPYPCATVTAIEEALS